jgi:hypothetical protein
VGSFWVRGTHSTVCGNVSLDLSSKEILIDELKYYLKHKIYLRARFDGNYKSGAVVVSFKAVTNTLVEIINIK